MVTTGSLYHIAVEDLMFVPSPRPGYGSIRARATGEIRKPRKGEWFLSGAIIEGYYAQNDLGIEYHIAELVTGVTVTEFRVTGVLKHGQ